MECIDYAAWLEAIGTILTVIVALFQKPIRDWWNRPIINILYEDRKPFKEIVEIDSSSSEKEKQIVIRIKINNEGNYVANHSTVNVDSYYKKRNSDETYVLNEFTPKILKDFRGYEQKTIAPHLTYLYNVAVIQKQDENIPAGEPGVTRQNYKLYLLGDGKYIFLGKGTFIVPLKFYSSATKSIIAYLKIFWDNDNLSTDKEHFYVKIISNKEFEKIKK